MTNNLTLATSYKAKAIVNEEDSLKLEVFNGTCDLTPIYNLRRSFFRSYPEALIKDELDKTASHFLVLNGETEIFCLTVHKDELPSERYVDANQLYSMKPGVYELKALCCKEPINEVTLRKAIELTFANLIEYFHSVPPNSLLIAVSSKNAKNITRYSKIGFSLFATFLIVV